MKHDYHRDMTTPDERRLASSKPSMSPARRIKYRASSSPNADGDESDDDTVPSEISHVEENNSNSVGQLSNRLWGPQTPGPSNAGSDDRAMQCKRAGDAASHRSLPASHAHMFAGGSLLTPPELRVSTRERTASAAEVDGILDKFADGTLFED
ncbi:hypothetical protein Slin15195_G042270 [Septoria linicola]|uniref:Uncharacterized protein n=1 Tax=Septoria linicola TaxID=215465 RepID=A0A9Q9ARM2_9PEZI|nr:hypothetical protein Slin15195_G042270 [Septoria linicola]